VAGGEENKWTNHPLLFRYVATIFVRKAKGDVAAVSVHHTADGVRVFWSKNQISEDDISHVGQITRLVETTAAEPSVTLETFTTSIFSLILENGQEKIDRRVETLRWTLERHGKDFLKALIETRRPDILKFPADYAAHMYAKSRAGSLAYPWRIRPY
jgi:hypothetical protein